MNDVKLVAVNAEQGEEFLDKEGTLTWDALQCLARFSPHDWPLAGELEFFYSHVQQQGRQVVFDVGPLESLTFEVAPSSTK
jgi:hypothetical protein